jgi:protein SCO1/2
LSVSFDPAYDTPKVLKSYGEAYTGQYTNATFQHWDFAAPPQRELAKVDQYFDVGVTPGQNGSLQHSLSTTIIGKDGKVIAFYPTNDWSVADVLAKVKAAAE